jgi:Na+/H+ antiporter NhaD/arsenite permease-like protein
LATLSKLRIISARHLHVNDLDQNGKRKFFKRLNFPLNFVTAPLTADLFLLAILAIGRKEVHDGIIGSNNIVPYDIMLFFLSLAYIAISVDASGLIRWLAFKVLQWGGKAGGKLFFYLYVFFFGLAAFCGNDPVILSGTAFLSYMTRVSANIKLPTAWIYTQFAIANIASAILVSSNPTNLVLAGAFKIKFVTYTVNMIVPVFVTAIVLFPFLLFIIFHDQRLVPWGKIEIHDLPAEYRERKPVNPNIPHASESAEDQGRNSDERKDLRLREEIMNPFLDKKGAAFGAILMAVTLVVLLVVNATTPSHNSPVPVFYITLPAAVIMFCWDMGSGWHNRKKTREISRKGRMKIESFREKEKENLAIEEGRMQPPTPQVIVSDNGSDAAHLQDQSSIVSDSPSLRPEQDHHALTSNSAITTIDEKPPIKDENPPINEKAPTIEHEKVKQSIKKPETEAEAKRPTLESSLAGFWVWCQETFPTSAAVLAHLPFALVPFAFSMFVLVQALVTKGWVPVFAYGWNHWVGKTGTVGAIGGMGFLSVILCNVSQIAQA